MRSAVLAESLARMPPLEAAWILDALATVGRAGGPPFDLGLLAAVDLTAEDLLPAAVRRAAYESACSSGLVAAQELLWVDAFAPATHRAGEPRPLVPGTRPLTLGERKSLARSWRRDVLERLVTDPHRDVVELLLGNPHVTEDDVLRIATARRSSAEVLMLVASARRWSCRARIRRALVRNPRLPEGLAVRLVGLLSRPELAELAGDPHLPLRVAAAAARRRARPA
jgi:hypothetical protein